MNNCAQCHGRWWVWLFVITVVFSLLYLFMYPGLGSSPASWAGASSASTRPRWPRARRRWRRCMPSSPP
ncbi:cbb3-type cytochrome c oxidase N-terminal domain-containing protein [Mycobacterium tuberculosis]|uniref:cbb3-type cytochrome c oxidase N-terminal domain-containing protein n=1 Tax=Mycobacterium tuberculosis TaxID=1773 RepID=UPI00350F2E9F